MKITTASDFGKVAARYRRAPARADILMRCKSTDITIGDIKFIARLTTNRNLHCIPTWYRRQRDEREREKDQFIVLGQAPLEHITEIKAKCKRYTRHCMINKYHQQRLRRIEKKKLGDTKILKRRSMMQLFEMMEIPKVTQDYVI